MAFSDLDAGEEAILKSIEECNWNDLLAYCAASFKAEFGYRLAVDYDKDMAIFKKFVSVYGRNGILAVKWVFYKYHGRYKGETFSVSWFASNRRWWIDQMVAEVTAEIRKPVRKTSSSGFLSVRDLTRGAVSA